MKRLPLLAVMSFLIAAPSCESPIEATIEDCSAVNVTSSATSVYVGYDPGSCTRRPKSLSVSFYGDDVEYHVDKLGYAKFHSVWFHGPDLWHQKYGSNGGLVLRSEDIEKMITEVRSVVLHI